MTAAQCLLIAGTARAAATASLRRVMGRVTRALRMVAVAGWRARAEILTAGAFVGGWCLVTSGIVALTSPVAWRVSLGLLGLSLAGWKLAWVIVTDGLYALTRDDPTDETRREMGVTDG